MNQMFATQAVDQAMKKFGGTDRDKQSFFTVLEFLDQFPEKLSLKRKIDQNPLDLYKNLSDRFFRARSKIEGPKPPTTIPDDMVSYILEIYFNHHPENAIRIKIEHQHAMSAENMVGFLLEKYVATILENHGWAWCSGDFIRAIDMIKKRPDGSWLLLQIKNRDNTENSSSSAIRTGTMIKKWFRSFSKKNETNWAAFPDLETRHLLSEEGFKDFVKNYLISAKQMIGK